MIAVSNVTLWAVSRPYRMIAMLFLQHRNERLRRPLPFHPRPDCPAVYAGPGGRPLDLNLRRVHFPCGALPGCGGPGCRWARQGEYPLSPAPENQL